MFCSRFPHVWCRDPLFHHLENIHEYNVLRCKKYDYRTLTANSLLAHKNSHKHDRKKLKSSMKPKRNADTTQWNFGSKKGCRKLVNFFSEKFWQFWNAKSIIIASPLPIPSLPTKIVMSITEKSQDLTWNLKGIVTPHNIFGAKIFPEMDTLFKMGKIQLLWKFESLF